MSDFQFQLFETIRSEGNKLISLDDIINKIKNRDDKTAFINAIREAGDQNDLCEIIKAKREHVAWNACFYRGNNDQQIERVTGVIYMAKDNVGVNEIKAFKSILMTFPYVVAAWQSFDGRGIGCLVRCDEVSMDNFDAVWNAIDSEMGFEFDEKYRSMEHVEALSYDADVFYNPDDSPFLLGKTFSLKAEEIYSDAVVHFTDENVELPEVQHDILYLKECDHIAPLDYDYDGERVRYQTEFTDHVFGDKEYRIFEDGIPFCKINTYFKAI